MSRELWLVSRAAAKPSQKRQGHPLGTSPSTAHSHTQPERSPAAPPSSRPPQSPRSQPLLPGDTIPLFMLGNLNKKLLIKYWAGACSKSAHRHAGSHQHHHLTQESTRTRAGYPQKSSWGTADTAG